MPQIEFDGIGEPIPTLALPPFGSDGNLPPATFVYSANTEFLPRQYEELGFTHFEVWCVGAAGGRGGDASNNIPYNARDTVKRTVPPEIWDPYINAFDNTVIYMYGVIIPGNPNYPLGGVPGNDYGWDMTHRQYVEFTNPNHLMNFTTYKPILLFPDRTAMGGGGGGGGMQLSSGVLVDLPDSTPVVVGQSGADSPLGQVRQVGIWTPTINDLNVGVTVDYYNSYPPPNPSYSNPQFGVDGGASTFADTVARASGGKGGGPAMVWTGSAFARQGYGGAGGLGGTAVAGGGGGGSTVEGSNGGDGLWQPVTGIGAGGGGGKGGTLPTSEGVYDPRFPPPPLVQHLASAGGQGSYNFEDTSVYGQRQSRSAAQRVNAVYSGGVLTFVPAGDPQFIIPGGGGGARPATNVKAGSYAPGYSPNGVVVVRLSRIV